MQCDSIPPWWNYWSILGQQQEYLLLQITFERIQWSYTEFGRVTNVHLILSNVTNYKTCQYQALESAWLLKESTALLVSREENIDFWIFWYWYLMQNKILPSHFIQTALELQTVVRTDW
jgi:hypothetical protein